MEEHKEMQPPRGHPALPKDANAGDEEEGQGPIPALSHPTVLSVYNCSLSLPITTED